VIFYYTKNNENKKMPPNQALINSDIKDKIVIITCKKNKIS
jgi:hypothetical protein